MAKREVLYEKCADCHLFIEPNEQTNTDLALWLHLHRGDDEDEALDATHEAKPSGMRANLATWKAYGPLPMRVRFIEDEEGLTC